MEKIICDDLYKGHAGTSNFHNYLESIKGFKPIHDFTDAHSDLNWTRYFACYFDSDNVTLFAKYACPQAIDAYFSKLSPEFMKKRNAKAKITLYGAEQDISNFEKKINAEVEKLKIKQKEILGDN